MKKIFLFSLLILTTGSLIAQQKVLKFNANGSFKIIQFTDVHYNPEKEKESAAAIQLINEVLDAEKADLVVFTGDIIFGKSALEGLDRVFEPVVKRQIPWAYVLGNHDDEFGVSRRELMDFAMSKPYCLAQHGDEYIKGIGNYVLEVKGSESKDLKTVLYFMDSGAYSNIKKPFSYAWLDFSQVNWYQEQSDAYTKRNEGSPYPALAFFHIPLPEYTQMTSAKDSVFAGEKRENECPPKLNTGMFTAMREAGDVMGTFVGHDHDNDYIGSFYDIYLAYGRFSGGNTVYNNLGLNGCRVIELAEGKREFTTYIRLLGGQKLYEVNYPSTFLKKEEKGFGIDSGTYTFENGMLHLVWRGNPDDYDTYTVSIENGIFYLYGDYTEDCNDLQDNDLISMGVSNPTEYQVTKAIAKISFSRQQ